MRLKFLHRLVRVVDERESGALAATILCPEAEDRDLVLVGFVDICEFLAELVFGNVGAVWVEDVTVLYTDQSPHTSYVLADIAESLVKLVSLHDHLLSS